MSHFKDYVRMDRVTSLKGILLAAETLCFLVAAFCSSFGPKYEDILGGPSAVVRVNSIIACCWVGLVILCVLYACHNLRYGSLKRVSRDLRRDRMGALSVDVIIQTIVLIWAAVSFFLFVLPLPEGHLEGLTNLNQCNNHYIAGMSFIVAGLIFGGGYVACMVTGR